MRSDSPRNSAHRGVLRRLLGQISTKTVNALERLALSASDRLEAYKMRDVSFQGVQTLETRTLLSADFALDDVNEINELADSTATAFYEFFGRDYPDYQEVYLDSHGCPTRGFPSQKYREIQYYVCMEGEEVYRLEVDLHGKSGVLLKKAGDQWPPQADSLDDGGIVAKENLGSTSSFIGAQRFDSTGSTVGGEFQVNTSAENVSDYSDYGYKSGYTSDVYDVVYSTIVYYTGDGYRIHVYGQRHDASGNPLGGEFQINF